MLMCGIAGYSLSSGSRVDRTLAAQALLTGIAEARQALAAASVKPAAEAGRGPLAERLAGRTPAEQDRLILEMVRRQAAAVLEYASPDALRPGTAFRDLGFDSVTAVAAGAVGCAASAVSGSVSPSSSPLRYPASAAGVGWLNITVSGSRSPVALLSRCGSSTAVTESNPRSR